MFNAQFQILAEKNGCLDFGDFVPGGGKTLTFKLVNETRATIPIRLVISAVSFFFFTLILTLI